MEPSHFQRVSDPMASLGLGNAGILFQKTTQCYSRICKYYSDKSWMDIIKWLLNKRNLSMAESFLILDSKLMRWCHDNTGRKTTLRDFKKWNDETSSKPKYKDRIEEWLTEYGAQDMEWYQERLNEDAMGGVSAPMATLNNTPGMGNAIPAGVGKMGSGDKWGNTIGKKPYTQSANPKKKKKKKVAKPLEEENINPYDKLGVAMAKKMGVKTPFKKKKDKKNQNSMTQTKMGEMKIMPFEEFKRIFESKNNQNS